MGCWRPVIAEGVESLVWIGWPLVDQISPFRSVFAVVALGVSHSRSK